MIKKVFLSDLQRKKIGALYQCLKDANAVMRKNGEGFMVVRVYTNYDRKYVGYAVVLEAML